MENVDLIVKSATIVTMDQELRILEDHSIVVKDSRIAAIEPSRSVFEKYESPRSH